MSLNGKLLMWTHNRLTVKFGFIAQDNVDLTLYATRFLTKFYCVWTGWLRSWSCRFGISSEMISQSDIILLLKFHGDNSAECWTRAFRMVTRVNDGSRYQFPFFAFITFTFTNIQITPWKVGRQRADGFWEGREMASYTSLIINL